MSIRVGQTFEAAIWIDGRETPEQRAQFETDLKEAMRQISHKHRLALKATVFVEKKPGEDRVPPVPDHIQGPNVRLLVAEAEVMAVLPDLVRNSFLGDLDPIDLQRLRIITRRVGKLYGNKTMTDQECDRIIEAGGPEAAMNAVRREVDGGSLLH